MSILKKLKKMKKSKKLEWGEPEGESGSLAQEAILEAIDNQIRDSTPPETNHTLQRLMNEGYSEIDAKKLIAGVLVQEMYGILREEKEYDEERYINGLRSLPDSAFEL